MMDQPDRPLTGACSHYCEGCTDHLAFINDDKKLKKKLAKQFSGEF